MTEIINGVTGFIPLAERRDDGTPVSYHSATIGGPRQAMERALMTGCCAIPLAHILVLTAFLQAMEPVLKAMNEPDESGAIRKACPRYWWLLASGLMGVVSIRIYMLSAWEAAVNMMD